MKRADRASASASARRAVVLAVVALAVAGAGLLGAGPANAVAGPLTPANISVTYPAGGKINPFAYVATGGQVQYGASALPAGLLLDPITGVLSGRPTSPSPTTTYTITAVDSQDGTQSTTSLTVTVQAVLAAPAGPVVAAVGVPLLPVYAFLADGFIQPAFTLGTHPAWLGIDARGVLTGTPDAATPPFTLLVTATDVTGFAATATIVVSVTATSLNPASQVLTGRVGTVLAPAGVPFPASAGQVYSSVPDIAAMTGLTFSPTTGAITGSPTKPIPPTVVMIQQTSTSTGAVQADSTLSVTIDGFLGSVAQPLRFVAGSGVTPVAPFGPGSAQISGLQGAATFTIAPALPTGLLLDSTTGVISGVPLVAGSRDYVVTATDPRGAKATGTVTLLVAGSVSPAVQSITGSVATSLTSVPLTVTGLKSPVVYSINPPPPGGLAFDTATGVLSGIPTVPIAGLSFVITATDAAGAKATASLAVSVSKVSLSVPVIGTVTGGNQIGSIIVYFARPSFAPVGQVYTVKVFDSTGLTLVTSLTTTSSPATVTGLVGGETYQVIVVANATDSSDAVESLPRTGTATSSSTGSPVTFATGGTVASTSNSAGARATLGSVGITIGSTSQAKRAGRAFSTKPPSRKKSKAPKVKLPLDTYATVVLPGVKVKGSIDVEISVGGRWLPMGFIEADTSSQLSLPTVSASTAGAYLIRLTPPAGRPGYVRIVFAADLPTRSPKPSANGSQGGF
jgi:hypothetical protein